MPNLFVSLAGEFFVLAQLALREYVSTLTLGNTKSVDILISNPKTGGLFRVEVKTARRGPFRYRPFGENLEWMMSEKHESIIDNKLFYCFVLLKNLKEMPRFFIVPSKRVAKYVKEEHELYLKVPRERPVKDNKMRLFRISVTKGSHGLRAEDFEDRWDFFERGKLKEVAKKEKAPDEDKTS